MRYVARLVLPRVGLAVLTLLAVSLIIFWTVELLPGDAATRILGRESDPERAAALREELHLDEPALQRYGAWLGGLVRGDWGESLAARRPVTDYVVPRLRNTLILAGSALALYVPLSLALGIATAVSRGRRWVDAASALILVGTALPEFVVAILLLIAFAVVLPWFPPLSLIGQARSVSELLRMLALPAVTLTIAMTAYAVRMMQGSLASVLDSDYVRLATLKGLPRRRVVLRHALPNALGPALRVTVLNVAWLIGGVVFVEVVFNFPGIGRLLVEAIRLLDTPVIEAIAMILASVYILANLAADLVAAALNPRLRTAAR